MSSTNLHNAPQAFPPLEQVTKPNLTTKEFCFYTNLAEQTAWLQQAMSASRSQWQVLGQQVLMARMLVPAPIVLQTLSVSAYGALVAKARTAPQSLTATEQAVLAQPAIPYNLDAWDGYAVARETVFGMATRTTRGPAT